MGIKSSFGLLEVLDTFAWRSIAYDSSTQWLCWSLCVFSLHCLFSFTMTIWFLPYFPVLILENVRLDWLIIIFFLLGRAFCTGPLRNHSSWSRAYAMWCGKGVGHFLLKGAVDLMGSMTVISRTPNIGLASKSIWVFSHKNKRHVFHFTDNFIELDIFSMSAISHVV